MRPRLTFKWNWRKISVINKKGCSIKITIFDEDSYFRASRQIFWPFLLSQGFTNFFVFSVASTRSNLDRSNIEWVLLRRLKFRIAYCLLNLRNEFNPNWHELWKQEKCSSLEPPRAIFHEAQWAWQDVKLTWLMSIFTSKNVLKFLIRIWSKKNKRWKVPCLMPIRVNAPWRQRYSTPSLLKPDLWGRKSKAKRLSHEAWIPTQLEIKAFVLWFYWWP